MYNKNFAIYKEKEKHIIRSHPKKREGKIYNGTALSVSSITGTSFSH